MIEADRVRVLKNEPEWITVPSASGVGQSIARCPKCWIAVWSIYPGLGHDKKLLRIVRVGTLDKPDLFPPDIHIWTAEKQPWIVLQQDVPAFKDGTYDRKEVWSQEALDRGKEVFRL
ncbi:hypothetical protein A1O3_02597 [Capronia epimyces CBS 606.96]|uniref:CENP-V/GFA domain-containing protein n=1 Tax=Capronia epimyces CBS 606.96 TaxID=1182542 RepID=W9YIM9_9EURO|nr:uncharacterized protein A1O3_02597 [Capronia epimyces CBS 606.96]EXJ89530.1 hypothetical protein A1O3_02597 [Capronia epimyces CBS 606.96]